MGDGLRVDLELAVEHVAELGRNRGFGRTGFGEHPVHRRQCVAQSPHVPGHRPVVAAPGREVHRERFSRCERRVMVARLHVQVAPRHLTRARGVERDALGADEDLAVYTPELVLTPGPPRGTPARGAPTPGRVRPERASRARRAARPRGRRGRHRRLRARSPSAHRASRTPSSAQSASARTSRSGEVRRGNGTS